MRGAVAAVLMLGLLVGCDAPEPKVEDDPTPTGTPTSASPTSSEPTHMPTGAAEPELPVAAQENSDAGAEAFVRWWVDLVNFAQATGDTAALVAVNDSRCEGCAGLVAAIDEPYKQGGHIEGGAFAIGRVQRLPLDHEADWAGFAKGTVEPQTVVDGSGEASTSTGSAIHLYAYAAWLGDRWGMRWFRAVVPA